MVSGDGCLVHCKSGKSRAAAIVIAYLMRKFEAPLKEVFLFVVARTGGEANPNPTFLTQLVDYEVEILGRSSMEGESSLEPQKPVLNAEILGIYLSPQGDELEGDDGVDKVSIKLRSMILANKWKEIEQEREKNRDDDFGTYPLWIVSMSRAIYQAVLTQINFVAEKVPTPDTTTTQYILNYMESTTSAIQSAFGLSPESNSYRFAFYQAMAHSLAVENRGIGSIFVEDLSRELMASYRKLHTSKGKESDISSNLLETLLKKAKGAFSLFKFLSADPQLSSYLELYESSLATRLSLFLPIQGAPTHSMLAIENEISSLIPHPIHQMKVKRMLADINKVPELNANWEASTRSATDSNLPKLEVALLDASVWPTESLNKALGLPSHPTHSHSDLHHSHEGHDHACNSETHSSDCQGHHHHHHGPNPMIPEPIVLPEAVYGAWDSFKSFVQQGDEDKNKLVLLPHLGDATMTCEFGGKQYTLDVTTPMMLVLCGFNEAGDGPVSFEELLRQSNLPPKILTQTLYSLSQPNVQLILRRTETPEDPLIKESDRFELNEEFSSKLRRIKVPNLKYPPK